MDIIYINFHTNLPGANELAQWGRNIIIDFLLGHFDKHNLENTSALAWIGTWNNEEYGHGVCMF